MPAVVAKIVCGIWVAALFYLNRDKSVRTSPALWIPVLWLAITGSRPITMWLGIGGSGDVFQDQTVAALDNGNPIEALFYGTLTLIGIVIIGSRWRSVRPILATSWPVLLYFGYCLLSVAWSDSPDIAVKRWIKATGDVVMALLVVTDPQPLPALRRLLSRLGFLLLPFSVIAIRYIPQIGRYFEFWDGSPGNGGVTLNKNALGVDAFILGLGALWQVLRLLPRSNIPNRSRQLIAQGILLAVAVYLCLIAHSATAGTCFTLTAALMLILHTRKYKGHPKPVKSLILTLVVLGVLIQVSGARTFVIHDLIGRKSNLTDRADKIWPVLIPMCPNVLLGAGFESFWTGDRMAKLWSALPGEHLNQSHNGYIEVYLQLGLVGLILLGSIWIHGYRTAVAAIRNDPNGASLMLVYILAVPLYNYTEAGCRMLFYTWTFFLLLVMMAGYILKNTSQTKTPQTTRRAWPAVGRGPFTEEWRYGQQPGVRSGFLS